ncbi:two-component system KDP operon response regulator KdpE [Malaciobacter marinus]|jgi:two-component system KDP operon response regulator KdpE|uniref:Two-component system KDP operon response regulator KdpE n=1 Tax=Malaciobacter marinus TaxID=505249 RepID=A0AB36ZX97_9BACT|nr:response regulator transcription factor [Malaciobacter marinus]PPK60957.1 two-component system KDP operon response regulator KdpE [Malaciobacter marinus]SKB43858.1 two-component system, OmpR family, KDP operon response regulator KdpE [Malaciobacter marinus]
MKKLIHIVEDDTSVKKLLEITFKEYEFNYISSESKKNAMLMFLSHSPNLMVVDLGLPDGDGKDLIKQIREISKIPIIVLTARHDEKEIISALDVGADDYITKPFSVNELLARIRATLRRDVKDEVLSDKFTCNELELNISTRDITLRNEKLKLTPIEYELLKYFILNANKTLTHRQILHEVWGTGYQNEMQYLRTYVNTLRKKIEKNSTRPEYIKTESGIGYRFGFTKES